MCTTKNYWLVLYKSNNHAYDNCCLLQVQGDTTVDNNTPMANEELQEKVILYLYMYCGTDKMAGANIAL